MSRTRVTLRTPAWLVFTLSIWVFVFVFNLSFGQDPTPSGKPTQADKRQQTAASKPAAETGSLWKQHVEPLLRANCFKCHGGAKKEGELDLRTLDSLRIGGDRGPSVIPGKPTESHLFLFLQKGIEPHMPPDKQLAKEEIKIIERWIERLGDPDQLDSQVGPVNPSDESASKRSPSIELPVGLEPTLAIDLLIELRHLQQQATASPICNDSTFVRRVFLDLVGRVPTTEERASFLSQTESDKRAVLVDRLLASTEFADHMAEQFDGMLMGRKGKQKKSRRVRQGWMSFLSRSFHQNRPWNQIAADILLARPEKKSESGQVWYLYERKDQYQEIAEAIAPHFFGVQIQCAQCHDHPLASEILQRHYWGLVAFYKRGTNVSTADGPRISESAVGGFEQFTDLEGKAYDNLLQFLKAPRVNEDRPQGKKKLKDSSDLYRINGKAKVPKFSRREKFVEEVLSGNPLVARSFTNRMWGLLVGRGLVHPVDKMDSAHPPSHPKLLDWLAHDFETNEFNIKRLVRSIVLTKTYQRSSLPVGSTPVPEDAFAYGLQKPLTAEMAYRSLIVAVTDQTVLDDVSNADAPELLTQLRMNFPKVLAEEKNSTLKQTLFLSNHPAFGNLLKPGDGNLTSRLISQPNESGIQQAFGRVYGRAARAEELGRALEFLNRPISPLDQNAQNLVWAMLTSSEFWINH